MIHLLHSSPSAAQLSQLFGLELPVQAISSPIEVFSFQGETEREINFALASTPYFRYHSYRLFLPIDFSNLSERDINRLTEQAILLAKKWGAKRLLVITKDMADHQVFTSWQQNSQHHVTLKPDMEQTVSFVEKFKYPHRYSIEQLTNTNKKDAHQFIREQLGHSALVTSKVDPDVSLLAYSSQCEEVAACLLGQSSGKQLHIHALAIAPAYQRSPLYLFMLYQLSKVVVRNSIKELTFSFFDSNPMVKQLTMRSKQVSTIEEFYLHIDL
ncbi:hypothetical protein [Alteromonas sp. ASW11-130]|uniref:hypothetical protein n=1 Tax=Alteromonas sp. ASW11-130 TaxID=3015775 RepID=UPI002242AAE0|nr:hypothetical protein [Alteromonas sp. ASW11-130]MCW8090711.1 hypothetical protein [Alteromonas sp. ASW11-130]